jgi:hypothetical protein
MADLATLQARMAGALLEGRYEALAGRVADGPVAAREALAVHRDTALHGLVQALRLTFPTVEALVGAAFFDQAALAFALEHPPASAWLTGYGAGFAPFLAAYEPAAGLPYLADVARLDQAIEAAATDALGADGARLDLGQAVLVLDASLRLIDLDFPAHAIRDAVDSGDEAALAALDVTARRTRLALWRLPQGAGLRELGAASFALLDALLQGRDPAPVLDAGADPEVLRDEVFAAPFVRIQPRS